MQIEIRRLHRDTGVTIIYVTHDQEEALALSDRICLMNQARIEQVGTPRQIYESPETAFAADFIGVSTIFRGELNHDKLRTSDGDFALPERASPGPGTNRTAALVIRPEHIRIGSDSECRVSGHVVEAVYAGAETRLILKLRSGTELTVRIPAPAGSFEIGSVVEAGWNRANSTLVPA
jgi:putative spermidine/putrescine transport system ATP-binding protein